MSTKAFQEQIELHELRELKEKAKELAKYARHKQSCKLVDGQISMSRYERHTLTENDCTCGLNGLLRAVGHEA